MPAALAWILQRERFADADLPLAAGGLGLALLLTGLLRRSNPSLADRACLGLALVLALLPPLLGSARLAAPVTNDERSYLYQAELFTEGRLTEALPPLPEAWRRRQVAENEATGARYSKYPPGTALGLTPGVALGWAPLIPALAGLLDVLLVAWIARRLGLARPGLAALLLAAAPLFLLTQTSFQSEVFTAPAALGAYGALLVARTAVSAGAAARWAALAGACAGWVMLARPLTGLLLACALGWGFVRAPRRWSLLAAAAAAGLPFLIGFLLYNRALTGDALLLPYHQYALQFGPFDAAGAPRDVYGKGDFAFGMVNQLGAWSVGFTGVLGAAALGFWGLWRLRGRDGGAALALAVISPVAYSFHWYAGAGEYLGPLYCYETLGLLVLGALLVLDAAPAAWRRGWLAAALLAGPIAAGSRWGAIEHESRRRSAPERAAAGAPPGAVVFLLPAGGNRMDDLSLRLWTPSRPSDDPAQPLILRALPELTPSEVLTRAGLAGRPAFRFQPNEDATDGSLIPLR